MGARPIAPTTEENSPSGVGDAVGTTMVLAWQTKQVADSAEAPVGLPVVIDEAAAPDPLFS